MPRLSIEEVKKEEIVLENFKRDFFTLAKRFIEPLSKADIDEYHTCGEMYKFNLIGSTYQGEHHHKGVYTFLINLKPKRGDVGAPEFTFRITMTNLKLEGEKNIKCKVEISLSKSYTKSGKWGKDKLKSKIFKYKIGVNGYNKKSIDKMEKEILAWASSKIGSLQSYAKP